MQRRWLVLLLAPFWIAISVAAFLFATAWGLDQLNQSTGSGTAFADTALEQGAIMITLSLLSFAMLIGVVVVVARVLGDARLSSHPHAFGLPPGSVRALIALAFLVFLAVISVFSIQTARLSYVPFGSPLTLRAKVAGAADEEVAAQAAERFLRREIADELARSVGSVAWKIQFKDIVSLDETSFELTGQLMVATAQDDANELSREVLTIIATALTAIVGFYFGSRSFAAGVEKSSGSDGDRATIELTTRRTKNRLAALAREGGIIERKFGAASRRVAAATTEPPERWKELSGGGEDSVARRLDQARRVVQTADAELLRVDAAKTEREALLKQMRDAIDDLQSLEAVLDDIGLEDDAAPLSGPATSGGSAVETGATGGGRPSGG